MSILSLDDPPRADASPPPRRMPPHKRLRAHSRNGAKPADVEDARRLLAHCVLFRKLAPHERNILAARAHIRKFDAGDTIFLKGTLHDSMLAVLHGEVRISMSTAEGKVFALVHAGEVFGEIAMLDGKPRSADAKALTPCSLAVLDRRDVLAVLARNPTAWLGLVEVLCSRLRHTDQHLVEVALLGVQQRLAKSLLRIVDAPPNQASNPQRAAPIAV
jgi:CRP-like cAMP-binding protein